MMYDEREVTTPFGPIRPAIVAGPSGSVALLRDEGNPHAAIYGAKELGATVVIELLSIQPVDRLLEPGDVLIPDDLVDLTSGRRSTFFVNKGYGFLPQRPVFCPDVRAALLSAARSTGLRSFSRGVLAVAEDRGRRQQAREWGAHALGLSGAPAAYLARELELCYAAVGSVAAASPPELLDMLVERTIERLPATRECACAVAMQATRRRGLVGDNWKTWL